MSATVFPESFNSVQLHQFEPNSVGFQLYHEEHLTQQDDPLYHRMSAKNIRTDLQDLWPSESLILATSTPSFNFLPGGTSKPIEMNANATTSASSVSSSTTEQDTPLDYLNCVHASSPRKLNTKKVTRQKNRQGPTPHNLVERRYRNSVNQAIYKLERAVPNCWNINSKGQKLPLTKSAVLDQAYAYIKYLERLASNLQLANTAIRECAMRNGVLEAQCMPQIPWENHPSFG